MFLDGFGHPYYLSEISNDLKGIMKGIGEHKEDLVNTLEEKQAILRMEETAEEETKEDIIMALQGMTSAIKSGHDNVASAFISGSNDIKQTLTDGTDLV